LVVIVSLIGNYAQGIQEASNRYAATGFGANIVALICSLGMPVAWYLTLTEARGGIARLLRLVNYAFIPIAFYSILLTASRAGALATLPCVAFMLASLTRFRPSRRIFFVAMSIAGLLVLLTLAPEASLERLQGLQHGLDIDRTSGGRVRIWREGLSVFSRHPFLGVGSRAFATAAFEMGHVGHNFVVSLLVEVGIVGFCLFLTVLGMVTSRAMHLPKPNSRLWLATLAAWLINASFHDIVHFKVTWLFFGLVIVDSELSARREHPA
jgi:O-antigen ligase